MKALQGRFVIPDFSTFTEETQKLFSRCRQLLSVQVSVYYFIQHFLLFHIQKADDLLQHSVRTFSVSFRVLRFNINTFLLKSGLRKKKRTAWTA